MDFTENKERVDWMKFRTKNNHPVAIGACCVPIQYRRREPPIAVEMLHNVQSFMSVQTMAPPGSVEMALLQPTSVEPHCWTHNDEQHLPFSACFAVLLLNYKSRGHSIKTPTKRCWSIYSCQRWYGCYSAFFLTWSVRLNWLSLSVSVNYIVNLFSFLFSMTSWQLILLEFKLR